MKDDESCFGCIIRDKAGQIWGRERFSVGIYLTGDLTRAEASVFEQGPSLWTSGRKGVTAMVSHPQGSRGQGALQGCQGQREHTAERGTIKGNLQMRQDTLKRGEERTHWRSQHVQDMPARPQQPPTRNGHHPRTPQPPSSVRDCHVMAPSTSTPPTPAGRALKLPPRVCACAFWAPATALLSACADPSAFPPCFPSPPQPPFPPLPWRHRVA